MTKKMKKRLHQIIISIVLLLIAVIAKRLIKDLNTNLELALFLVAYFSIGHNVLKQAGKNIVNGQVFDENFLMTIATMGAFFVGEYPEAVFVMLFYQVGEFFQSYAVNKSRKSIADLMDIRPDYANVMRNRSILVVDPEEVSIGEVIVIKPGEKVPLDGRIIKGNSIIDTMALTGESVPLEVLCGEDVISGCINITGVIEVEVKRAFGESTVSKILELVENASSKKAEAENFITKFAKYYTPAVVISAAVLAIIPPLVLGGGWYHWLYRALTFLVISCPCALVISIPLSFFGGLGGAGRHGILIKGSNYLEALAKTEIIVMDKTGTLTKGTFIVKEIVPSKNSEVTKEELLEIIAYAESYSTHPISKSLLMAYNKEIVKDKIGEVKEIAGLGVLAVINGKNIVVGNKKLMKQNNIIVESPKKVGTVVYVTMEQTYLGYIVIGDEIKEDAQKAIKELKEAGIKKIIMLTGDRKEIANSVANELDIQEVYSELLPVDKVDRMESILAHKTDSGKLIFVGDGINDAPVLARADIGIAMGALGSDAAIEAADIVIMTDEPSKIPLAIKISKKTLLIVKQNIILALGVKALVLILATIGYASMWAAVFADVGVAFLAILNAMRAMNIKNKA